jgi:phosphatidylethanolamine-binding protein (PEBP) family uncharacterized protein
MYYYIAQKHSQYQQNLGTTKLEEFNGFGCSGENSSPQLSWSNAPEGTKFRYHDVRDAPTGSGFGIGLFFDIPASERTSKKTLETFR